MDGPQSCQDPEKTALTTTVRSADERVHSFGQFEVQALDEDVSVWRDDGHIRKLNYLTVDDGTLQTFSFF